MPLTAVCLTGVHFTGVYRTGVNLTGMYFTTVYLMGVYLTGVHLTRRASHRHVFYSCGPHGRASLTGVHEGFCEDLARQNTITHLSQLQVGFRRSQIGFCVVAYRCLYCRIQVSVLSHMGFSHRRRVLRPLFRRLHGLLRYQCSSALF